MVMKHKVKRVIGLLLIAVLMSSVATGCGKTTLDNTVQNENKQKDSDAWMEDEAFGQRIRIKVRLLRKKNTMT